MSDKRGGSYVQGRYEIFAAGEVLGQSFDARLSSDNEGVPDSLRMRLYRTDPEGRLLGPLKATHYAVGDVSLLSTGAVAVVGADNKVEIRPVTVGERIGSDWIISKGLQPGDKVIAEGTQKVRQGMTVNPKPFAPEAAAADKPAAPAPAAKG